MVEILKISSFFRSTPFSASRGCGSILKPLLQLDLGRFANRPSDRHPQG